jgi:hypothetical protein
VAGARFHLAIIHDPVPELEHTVMPLRALR